MGKFFLKFFLLILTIITSVVIFLSYYGFETGKFDNIIKTKVNEVNEYIKLEFNKTKIYLKPTKLSLVVKLQSPKIIIQTNNINLSKLDLFLSLKSLISSDFLLKKVNVVFEENDIKDLTKITNVFLPKFLNKQLNKVLDKGKLEGEFIIPFSPNGKIRNDYEFSGKVKNATINLPNEFSIKNLTTEIKHVKKGNSNEFNLIVKDGSIYDMKLAETTISLKRGNKNTKINSILTTKGKFNYSQFKKLSNIFGVNYKNLNDVNGKVDLKTSVSFDIDKKFKVNNLLYSTDGNIVNLEIITDEISSIKKYLPEYNSKIILKNTNTNIKNSKINHIVKLNGYIKMNENFDSFKIQEIYNYNNKSFNINGNIDLENSKIRLPFLNYSKNYGINSKLDFDINFILKKYYIIKRLNFSADKTLIDLLDINLNKKFEVEDFKEITVKTFNNKIKNNDFSAKKSKSILIEGKMFDAEPLLKSLYKKSDKQAFSKKFNSQIKINFNKTLTGTNDDLTNLTIIASINKGSYDKLSLKGNFSKNEIVEMSIYQVNKDNKTLQVISDRARPFVKNFDFVKGFEGGKLEYESIIKKKITNSNLIITDFKVSKVPALAKLLTLASLQGIADTLNGDGIRFESFEMKSNSEGNVLNIEDALAIGPAVSMLLEGYVDKGNLVSLRGTLVPATKLNSIIASIPVLGDILVGKKTGEGVVGVSFKMKGPPKNIKTTVNPIKTLTPRFIVRAVEKMKKGKKEGSK